MKQIGDGACLAGSVTASQALIHLFDGYNYKLKLFLTGAVFGVHKGGKEVK